MHDFMLMHEILTRMRFFNFNAWGFWFSILLLSLNQIFLWNHWIHWLNFELSFWEKPSQILMLDTKLLIRSVLTFLMHMCRNGWMNKHTIKKC